MKRKSFALSFAGGLDLAGYRSENNFAWVIEIMWDTQLVARMLKFFTALSSSFKLNILCNYFDDPTKILKSVSKFSDTSAKLIFSFL